MAPTGIHANARRFGSSDGLPASHRACARRCGDRLERDRAERNRGATEFDPAIAHARDCSRRDLRRGARRRPEGWRLRDDVEAPPDTSVEAAVVAAAYGSLVRLAPAERPMLDAALNVSLSKIPDGKGKTDGTALGQQIAEKIVALRARDGAAMKVAFTAKSGVGLYQPTPPQSLPAILAQWGAVTPFVLRNRAGLELNGPPDRYHRAVRA